MAILAAALLCNHAKASLHVSREINSYGIGASPASLWFMRSTWNLLRLPIDSASTPSYAGWSVCPRPTLHKALTSWSDSYPVNAASGCSELRMPAAPSRLEFSAETMCGRSSKVETPWILPCGKCGPSCRSFCGGTSAGLPRWTKPQAATWRQKAMDLYARFGP